MRASSPLHFASHFSEYLRKRNLQHLIVHVTNHCNLRCEHCFVDFAPKRDLKLADFERLGREVGRLYWLDVGGGEPFLRKDLPEIVSAFDARVVQIPTNGSFKEQIVAVARRIRADTDGELGVALSLDGLQETHERIRGAPGNWEQVWETFEELRRIDGLSVYVNTVLMRENEHEILELMEEVWRRRPDFHAVTLLRGGPVDPRTTRPDLEELRSLAPEVSRITDRYGSGRIPLQTRLARNYHRYVWNLTLQTLEQETQPIPCLAGSASLVVWGDGRVGSCEMRDSFGDILGRSWSEVLGDPARARQLESIRRAECHCTHNCALFDSIMFRPSSLKPLLWQRVS